MLISALKNKKILILGIGKEGLDTFLFLRKLFPEKPLGIGDKTEFFALRPAILNLIKKDKRIKPYFGKNYLKALKNYDLIIKSPGIPLKTIKPFLSKNQEVSSQTKIFFDNCPGTIIGITGTKGKSSTASLTHQILKVAKIDSRLVGNIGKPALSSLLNAKKNSIFVYELSAHQLSDLKKSPHISIILNIYPEHLDYYRNFKEYVSAKANIARHQTKNDFLIYESKNAAVKEIAKKSKAEKISITRSFKLGKNYNTKKYKNFFAPGLHSKSVAAAALATKILGVSDSQILKALKNFKHLPHRLEFVGEFKGAEFYNDSLSTIPESTIEALNFFGDKVQTLILGGFDRGLNFKKLAKRILASKIENLILFPSTGKKIWAAIKEQNNKDDGIRAFFVTNMQEAVSIAFIQAKNGRICLLSPASPSFGIFKNYASRGNYFKKEVKKIGKMA